MTITVLWAISWLIDAALLGLSLRAMRMLSRSGGGAWRRMLCISLVLIALLTASLGLVLESRASWARYTAMLLTCGPALFVVVTVLYVALLAILVKDWK